MPTIGYLTSSARDSSASAEGFQGFLQRLEELGYEEGENLAIEHRSSGGSVDQFASLATNLVNCGVDVIVVGDSRAIPAVQAATDSIPIVMTISGDLVGQGLVTRLKDPGGNLTGLTQGDRHRPLDEERLEQLLAAVPGASRVAVLWNGAHAGVAHDYHQVVEPALAALGKQKVSLEVQNVADIENVLAPSTWQPADVLYVMPDPLTNLYAQRIVELVADRGVPAMYGTRLFADAGGLLYWGRNRKAMSRRAADYVDMILRGKPPGDLPIELPALFEFVINQETAATLGIIIPPGVLAQATE